MTLSEEDYIKAIYHLGKGDNTTVSTNSVAEMVETKPSSVTDMVKKLSDKGVVNYRPYKGVNLTEYGQKIALTLVRKHRLWEVFLVEKLGFSWDEVHEVAEQLEHIKSEKLIDQLDKHLGYPQVDPHGDPIPSKTGEFKKTIKKLLIDIPVGTSGICVGVKDSSPPFLKFLDKNKIALGDTILIVDKEEFDGSFNIQINKKNIHISNQIASNLYLKISE
ncbi:metal-dependent transcriptional regulator [Aurantibacter crassamenti]|uniref:metal-dependent transcriptional regulator n=1 Tax=Aurantibacter crassamenti TaxID=1837375 RepID=UPI001939E181|nr:metal-dependent transcriptional regulator [Aurantibacter crassamenti]MBM1105449.1 metal-dependent transcriptional regulator [Aurantibacter crassamenti]